MMKRIAIHIGVFGAALMAMATLGYAQGIDIGEHEYVNNCASCHGIGGKGDGPLAGLISQPIPDLTVLSKKNNGIFPFKRVYGIVDGTEAIAGHGTREMPVWGNEYRNQAPMWVGEFGSHADVESFVRGRILSLVGYVYGLEMK